MRKKIGEEMGQKGTMVKKPQTLRGDAVRWLDEQLHGKTFTQRYEDAARLLAHAGELRDRLEYALPKDMKVRGQRAKIYEEYKSIVAQLTADVEDAIQQMTKLRGKFLASENAGQREQYDNQLKLLKSRLDDFRRYAKWVPADLRRHEYRKADAAIAEALSPKAVPTKSAPSPETRKELREVNKEMKELKAEREEAKGKEKKATLARRINKLRSKRERLRAELEAPAVAAGPKKKEEVMDFTKFASKAERDKFFAEQHRAEFRESMDRVIDKTIAKLEKEAEKKGLMPEKKEAEMVFTEAENERYEREHSPEAEKKRMLAAMRDARKLNKEIAAKKKAGKSIAGLRRKWFEKWVEAVQLGADLEKVPRKVLEEMAKKGIPFERA